MKKHLLPALFLLFLLAPAWPDSIDDAEAAKRGVPPQQIQLEHIQSKITDLQNHIKSLQDQMKKQADDYNAQAKAIQDQIATVQATPPKPNGAVPSPSTSLATGRRGAPAAMAPRTPLESLEINNADLEDSIKKMENELKSPPEDKSVLELRRQLASLKNGVAEVRIVIGKARIAVARGEIAADEKAKDAISQKVSIATAIRWHEIIPGMTLDQAKEALAPTPSSQGTKPVHCDWQQAPAPGGGTLWTCNWRWENGRNPGPHVLATTTVVNGKVTESHVDSKQRDQWMDALDFIDPPMAIIRVP